MSLGCERNRAFLACRGGSELVELPYTGLSYSRTIDDMSDASVSIGHFTKSGQYVPPPPISDDCCGILAELEPWEHEIVVYRGDGEDPAWAGPVVKPTWTPATIAISARDIFQWFERRLLGRYRKFENVDLAFIFSRLVSDALHRDASPNIEWSTTATGITGDRLIDPNAFRRAADELRELARSGLDFTALGRRLIVGGTEIPTADLGTLITEHFDNLSLDADGLQTETESTILGSRPVSATAPVYAITGGADPDRGLVQNVTSESGIMDGGSAQAAADTRNALLSTTPQFISGRLLPSAPVSFDQLIPGAKAELRLQFFCKVVTGAYRLQRVSVNVDQTGNESITVEFTSLGTSLEES